MKIKLAVVTAIDDTMAILVGAQLKAAKKAGFEVCGVCSMGPRFAVLSEVVIKMKAIKIKSRISPFSDLWSL